MTEGVQRLALWMGTENGLFSIKSMYEALDQTPSIAFPWKCNWKNCVQPKMCLFGRPLGEIF